MRKKYYKLVGEKIRIQRELYSITTTEMASMIGIPHDDYARYETGFPIPPSVIDKLMEFYEVPLGMFLPTLRECNIFWMFPDKSQYGLIGIHDGMKYYRKGEKVETIMTEGYKSWKTPNN